MCNSASCINEARPLHHPSRPTQALSPTCTCIGTITATTAHAGLWLQWRGFGPGSHDRRPEPGGPLAHYDHCMPLQWPPKTLATLKQKGLPADAGQAATISKYGKTIANTFWVKQASTAHGFMYK